MSKITFFWFDCLIILSFYMGVSHNIWENSSQPISCYFYCSSNELWLVSLILVGLLLKYISHKQHPWNITTLYNRCTWYYWKTSLRCSMFPLPTFTLWEKVNDKLMFLKSYNIAELMINAEIYPDMITSYSVKRKHRILLMTILLIAFGCMERLGKCA